jgi:hypothetical protein
VSRRAALLLLALLLAGCASARTFPTPTPQPRGPVLTVHLALTGAADLTDTYTVRRDGYRTCRDLADQRPAAGDRPTDFGLPVPLGRPVVDGHPLSVAIVISPYHGPAHYATADIGDDDTLVALDDTHQPYQFTTATRADGEVRADGSGTMTLTHLENPELQVLSVTLAWSCAG